MLAAGAAVVVLLAAGWYWHRHHTAETAPVATDSGIRPSGSIDYSPAKPGDNAANNARKGSSGSSSTTIPESTPNSGGGQTGAAISIAGANKSAGTADSITVSATVENASTGTCTFYFSRSSGGPVVQSYSEPVLYTGTYYSCPPHPVQMPSPYSGSWYVSAALSSGGQTASDKWPYAVTL